ncbi:MAG: hypothetical protein AAGI23_00110 [Bacteroidota bacterium]
MKTLFLLPILVLSFSLFGQQDSPTFGCNLPFEIESRGFGDSVALWPRQVVPYEFTSIVSQSTKFAFLYAIRELEEVTNVCFVERHAEENVLI